MDEIEERIARIYAATGETAISDGSQVTHSIDRTEDGWYVARVDFTVGRSEEQLKNAVYGAIHNVANLKDHLKRWARSNGKDADAVKRAIDDSRDLQLVMDLSNVDKHGPLRDGDPGFSGLAPTLSNFRQGLMLNPEGAGHRNTGSVISFDLFGESPQVEFDGTSVQATADIIGRDGQPIGDAMAIVRGAVGAWEGLLADYGMQVGSGESQ